MGGSRRLGKAQRAQNRWIDAMKTEGRRQKAEEVAEAEIPPSGRNDS